MSLAFLLTFLASGVQIAGNVYLTRYLEKTSMVPGQAGQLEHILGNMSVGVAILDATTLTIRYANPYIQAFLEEPWCQQDLVGYNLKEVLPPVIGEVALEALRKVARTGQSIQHTEIPYEGALETRGRTYWRVSIKLTAGPEADLMVMLEDVTEHVRSRLHLNAIHHISSAIAGPSALPLVLDRILQALQEMVGSKRCAVLLLDSSIASSDARLPGYEELPEVGPGPITATVAAHKGIHPCSQDWRPIVTERLLLGRVIRAGQTLVLTNTQPLHDLELPYLDDDGSPCRPGSVLSVPIFDPSPAASEYASQVGSDMLASIRQTKRPVTVIGTIEVYHRRPRGFPSEEIELLERFAQQAGLAIQNARLFRSIDRWARTANRHARQKDNIMQAMPDAVIIFDPRWRIADANHAARRLFGWSENIVGQPIVWAIEHSKAQYPSDLLHLADPIAELERRALDGEVKEFRVIGANGQPYTLNCSYTPIRDNQGDIFAFIVIYRDITEETAARERIEAEVVARTAELAQRNQALQRAKAAQELTNARMALLLERLPSGVILVSAIDNTITIINQRAVQTLQRLGVRLAGDADSAEVVIDQVIGRNYEQLLRDVTLYGTTGTAVPYEEQPLSRAISNGEASEAELHITLSDNHAIYLLVNSAPLRAPDGSISSAILVLHEISKMKALERAREDFFNTIAHELKTPLANIRAHLTALLAEDLTWSAEERQAFLKTADEQAERLVGMVNQVLDASRVEAGALRIDKEAILLPEMMEDLQDRLEALITSSQRTLQINMPRHLPAVEGDYELIMSVLTNLLSNAFRYAPQGDIVRLDIEPLAGELGQAPRAVTLRVTDRGPGMSQEQQMALFTRFSTFAAEHRPDPSQPGQPAFPRRRDSRWSPATGLGLYISRGIIEAHGSTLTLKSSPGQGASFAFTLPVFVGKREQEYTA